MVAVAPVAFGNALPASTAAADLTTTLNAYGSYTAINEESVFNRRNFLNLERSSAASELLVRYLASPMDKRVTTKFVGYLSYSPQGGSRIRDNAVLKSGDASSEVVEAYGGFQPSDDLFLLVGRSKESWGYGLYWNPANLIDPKVLPDRSIDLQNGRTMVKAEYTTGRGALSLYLLPFPDERWSRELGGMSIASTGSLLLTSMDVNVGVSSPVGRGKRPGKPAVSAWASYAAPLDLVLAAEGAVFLGNDNRYPANEDLEVSSTRRRRPAVSYLVGAERKLPLGDARLEYYYNGLGYTPQERRDLVRGLEGRYAVSDFQTVAQWSEAALPHALAQRFVRASLFSRDVYQVVDLLSQVTFGIDDGSIGLSGTLSYHPTEHLVVNASATRNIGGSRFSEAAQRLSSSQVTLGMSYHF